MTIAQPASFNQTFSHHTATVNDIQLHYVIGGKGAPVVLLHGYPETWYAWRKIMPTLAEHYTVIVPDLRGFGDSAKPVTGYDKKTVAEDIHQLVRQLGHERIFLVAHDMGTPTAYAYAAAHPTEISRFIFIEGGIPGFGLEDFMDVSRGGRWHFGFFMAPKIPELLTAGREREFLTEFTYRVDVHNKTAISEADIDEYMRTFAAPDGMRPGFEHYRALLADGKYNRETFQEKLPMPILAVDGEKSFNGLSLQQLQKVAVNVRGSIIKDCGHFVAEDRPEELVAQIISFFQEAK